jgi:hypothetical protein
VEQTKLSLFQRPVWVVVLALTTAFAMAGLIVLSVARSSGRSFKANKAAIKHVNRQQFVLSDKKEKSPKIY